MTRCLEARSATRGGAFAWLASFGLCLAVGARPALASGAQDALPEARAAAHELLARAFAGRFDCDLTEVVLLVVRNSSGEERTRRVEVASKTINGRQHSLGRFTEPPSLRGTTILSIENQDRSDDHFLYLPSLRRVRRVTSAQRGESFLGTDLSYEDFERQVADEFEVEASSGVEIEGEAARRILARPIRSSSYDRVEFMVAEADAALLASRYYKRGAAQPFKEIEAPRASIHREAACVLPTRLRVRNLERRTETEVTIDSLRVNPAIDDGLFGAAALEVGRPIPGLSH